MKAAFTFFITICLSTSLVAQEIPGCNDWRVEEIYIDTSGYLAVTISNSCSDCFSGLQSCVYYEMQVRRTIFPFDTIGATNCSCLIGPENESSETYLLGTTFSKLPPISDLRVSLLCGDDGCDTIPFSPTLGTSDNELARSIKIYPNPVKDFLKINSPKSDKLTARVVDIVGRERLTKTLHSDSDHINLSHLPGGIYLIEISDENKKPIRTFKFMKE